MAYIDKELFKQDIKMRYCNNCARPNEIKCRACHIDDMLSEIEDAPIADVAEVVRCKNCRFNVMNMEKDGYDTTDYSGEDIVCSYFLTDGLEPTDFCSFGERENKHAHWEYWSGWAGNHDQRIEAATCSNCGYKHPTVRLDYVDGKFIKGYVPDKLAKECPKCGAKMDAERNDEDVNR